MCDPITGILQTEIYTVGISDHDPKGFVQTQPAGPPDCVIIQ